jgi:hypothetical protein
MKQNKYLLIDDLATKGWKSALELSVIKDSGILEVALTYDEAIEKLKSEWSVVFLDMRLTELDHKLNDFTELSGYRILQTMKGNFRNVNFATPVILFTASNKIWNIDLFNQYSIEGYYIKEHPNYSISKEQSRNNLENLQALFANSLVYDKKRKNIWSLCVKVIDQLEKHPYFKGQNPRDVNVKNRINDKIKLGYAQLFKRINKLEKELLLNYNEAMSFIVFWSILEEISKGFVDFNETFVENRTGKYERKGNWKFRNKEYFIERGLYKVTVNVEFKGKVPHKKHVTYLEEKENIEYKKYTESIINLSSQIFSLIAAYSRDEVQFKDVALRFQNINDYRNKVDFIHSDLVNIFKMDLYNEKFVAKAFSKNVEILELINEILSFPIK